MKICSVNLETLIFNHGNTAFHQKDMIGPDHGYLNFYWTHQTGFYFRLFFWKEYVVFHAAKQKINQNYLETQEIATAPAFHGAWFIWFALQSVKEKTEA